MKDTDALTLTRSLLRYDTINPPGNERECAHFLGRMLEEWGYSVRYHEHADRRTSVIARLGASDARAPLCLTGHIDTVPLGTAEWAKDPFAGESDGDLLYGRGSSDMKSGVAAIMVAARNLARDLAGTPGVVLVLTAAEEGGCVGSRHLAQIPELLGRAGAMIVGEPTGNYPCVGHKGTVKFWAHFHGRTAHGSMPHLGDNAVYKAAHAVTKLEAFHFHEHAHAFMGPPTLNVGMFAGGDTINSVPDEARVGVDLRTIPGMDHAALVERVKGLLGPDTTLDVFQDMPAVWTEPDTAWVQRVFEITARHTGERMETRALPFNTDAGNLLKAYAGAPTVILGPGETAMAHQTDEYCRMSRIGAAVAIYEDLIRDWCGI